MGLKIAVIAPNIFPLPPQGYSGLEYLVNEIALHLARKGHKVTVMAPKQSQFPPELGIELIGTELNEPEEQSYYRIKGRLESDEFSVIADHTWEGWAYHSSWQHEPELTIVHTIHTEPHIYQTPPPVRWPRFVCISESQAQILRNHLRIDARVVYNGVDFNLYKIDPSVKRNSRMLALGRYTPEKGFLTAMTMCRNNRIRLDVVGDTQIIGDPTYLDRCNKATDGVLIRAVGGVSRNDTVKFYQSYRGLISPLQWNEPFGLVPVEASACGMGVLTLNRGAMGELIKPGENGWAFEHESELEAALKDDWIDKIDPEKARKAVEKFSIQNMCENYEKIYTEAANGARW